MGARFNQKPRREYLERVERVRGFIRLFVAENGYNPSVSDVAEFLVVGRTSAYHFLIVAAARGHINFEPGKARTISVPALPVIEGAA